MEDRYTLLKILDEGLPRVKVLVVGDLILDESYFGSVERISPEAPIPVVRIDSRSDGLGGSGNVANNLSRLGCGVAVAGTVGMDAESDRLRGMLEEAGIDTASIVDVERVTTRKVRVVSARQQILRMDFETTAPLCRPEEERIVAGIERQVAAGIDAVVLSDYGKGVCTPGLCRAVTGLCRSRNIPLIVDPKGADWDRYTGCTLVTPNLKELGEAAQRAVPNVDEEVEKSARELMGRFGLENILVTRSEQGMSLVFREGVSHEPARAREVFDVSGAGDTVVAVVAAFLSAGASLEDAAGAANLAAGFVVGKAGTYAIGKSELSRELMSDTFPFSISKVRSREETLRTVEGWKAEGKRIVFTNGCFDILHAGHLHCLESARKLGDRLVVGLNSDTSVRLLKGAGRPVNRQELRAALLAALAPVDLVVVFEEETPLSLIQALKPDCIVKGGDYEAEGVVGAGEIVSWGGKVVIIPTFEDLSTTKILGSVLAGGPEVQGEARKPSGQEGSESRE